METMENVMVMDHPLIQHKISKLRDEKTGTNEFRRLVSEIAMLMGFEALRFQQKMLRFRHQLKSV